MPGFLYQSYCHETLEEVSDQILSLPELPWDGGFQQNSFGTPFLTGNSIFFFGTHPITFANHTFQFVSPSCDSLGYPPYLPGTVADYAPLWAGAMGIIVIAYAVRMAKVALGQGRS